MAWQNTQLLFGLALAAIPVLLHFLMRSKPRPLVFPALRLIQVRRRTNTRRLRLRHLWLMLLRVAAVALLVLALARPRLPPANYGLNLREGISLAAVVLLVLMVYSATVAAWRRKNLPNHRFAYQRALLRGGSGVAAAVLLLLLVVWPYWRRIDAELSEPRPDTFLNVPVSAVFVFDTSPSMAYQFDGRTRLEAVQAVARRFLHQLPPHSQVAVTDTAADDPILFQPDLSGALARIDTLKIQPGGRPLNDRVRTALTAQEADRERTLGSQNNIPADQRKDRFVREIYVLTDMAASAWKLSAAPVLRQEMERQPRVRVYLIDSSVAEPTNIALSPPELPKQTISAGGELVVRTTLDSLGGEPGERTVEVSIKSPGGELTKQGQRTVAVGSGGEQLEFILPGLTGPIAQGEIRLVSSDPLPADDVRYFTVAIAPPPRILIVADRRDDQLDLHDALAPEGLAALGKARYQVDSLPTDEFRGDALDRLSQYEVVCLVNAATPTNAAWEALEQYVQAGGGLFVAMGDMHGRTLPAQVAYHTEAARSVLPIGEQMPAPRPPADPPVSLDLPDLSHPILKKFEEFQAFGGAGELASAPVFQMWNVQPADGASVIARYTDGLTPALIEQAHGEGRVVLLTTGLALQGWSELPRADWQFVVFAEQLMHYLGQQSERTYNYLAGDDVAVPLDPAHPVSRYLLRTPELEQLPGDVPAGARAIVVGRVTQVGQYELRGADDAQRFHTGFSVNVPPGESDFTRLTTDQLDDLFGPKRYGIGHNTDDLEKIVANDRIPVDVFPNILALLIAAFVIELFVANRFYEADQEPMTRTATI